MSRTVPKEKSLAHVNPELAKQWHPSKNGNLTPFDITPGSGKKVWWKCEKGSDHIWQAYVYSRTEGSGCLICRGLKVVRSNCLATTNPELASEWHPTKNGNLTSSDVTSGTHKKVWWKCVKGDDHVWEASVVSRKKGNGCRICAGQLVVKSNCLATTNPKLASEWHPSKNGNLTPFDITPGSGKKVWWKCDKGDDHVWEASVVSRKKGNGCRICAGQLVVKSNCLATTNPKLASEWHPTKNGELTPFNVTAGKGVKVWWKCNKGDDHVWKASIDTRSKGNNCPVCSNYKVVSSNCLATTNPELASEWHPTKNGKLTPFQVSSGFGEKVWWKCNKGDDHEWLTKVISRRNGSNCPICEGKKVVSSNCLATTNPELASEWHPTKNGKLTSRDVTDGSGKKVWWKCDKGDDHEWKAVIGSRAQGNACPICAGQLVVKSNCLVTTNPELASEWHPTKNGKLTPFDVRPGSSNKVWWKCRKGDDHEWVSKIVDRSKGNNCPFCSLTPQSRQELIITHELLTIFEDINPKGFKTNVNGKIRSVDTYIPKLNLGIEFDGAYWHKGKIEMDKLKTQELESVGLNIIRVRQKPLKRIFDSDVMAEKKYDGKAITNNILRQILKDYNLNKRIINKIHNYLDKTKLQNEKGLNKYIDMILEEKASKNN